MTTTKSTDPLLFAVRTDAMPGIPKGQVEVSCVRYETYRMSKAEFDQCSFAVHDSNTPEALDLLDCMT